MKTKPLIFYFRFVIILYCLFVYPWTTPPPQTAYQQPSHYSLKKWGFMGRGYNYTLRSKNTNYECLLFVIIRKCRKCSSNESKIWENIIGASKSLISRFFSISLFKVIVIAFLTIMIAISVALSQLKGDSDKFSLT